MGYRAVLVRRAYAGGREIVRRLKLPRRLPKIAVAGGSVRDLRVRHIGRISVGRRQVKEMLAPLRIGLGHGQPFKLLRALAAGLCTVVRFAIGHGFKSETSFAKIATGIATKSTTIDWN